MKHYLAIDIGASSGRHIVGWEDAGALHTQEVYRFPNGVTDFLMIPEYLMYRLCGVKAHEYTNAPRAAW